MKKKQRKVEWNPGQNPTVAGRSLPPPRYEPVREIPPEEAAALAEHLYPGAMLLCKEDMYVENHSDYNTPFKVLTAAHRPKRRGKPAPAAVRRETFQLLEGDIVVYAGTVRFETESGKGARRVSRHTVIGGGERYIVDVAHLRPLEG